MRRAQRLSLLELAPYLLELPDPPARFDWQAIFASDRPVEIEVGFGKGLFLLTSAQANPDVNYVGVEIARKYQLFTATRMAKRQLRNVRLAKADAGYFLTHYVVSASCQAVHVYFPDPWWKKRHLKRRVFTPEFAIQCERVLRPEGRLYLATDVEEYFQVMAKVLAEHTKLRPIPHPGVAKVSDPVDCRTNFESKFRREGRVIHNRTYERQI